MAESNSLLPSGRERKFKASIRQSPNSGHHREAGNTPLQPHRFPGLTASVRMQPAQ